MMLKTPHPSRSQRGVATLLVMLIILVSMTMITIYAANVGMSEQRISGNSYKFQQLEAVADAGLDFAIAWLEGNNPTWVADPSDANFQIDDNSLSIASNGYTAAVQLRRSVLDWDVISVSATATDANGALSAVSRTQVTDRNLLASGPDAPIVIDGCFNSVAGAPNIHNHDGGNEVVAGVDGSGGCLDAGHFNQNGPPHKRPPPPDIWDNAFGVSAWDRTFGITKADMQALAAQQAATIPNVANRTIHWITDPAEWHTSLGSLVPNPKPVIIIFTACQKINGTTEIVGVVYFEGPCVAGGWGGGTIYGSLVVDGNMAGMNANATLSYDSDYVNSIEEPALGIQARVPGGWIDM